MSGFLAGNEREVPPVISSEPTRNTGVSLRCPLLVAHEADGVRILYRIFFLRFLSLSIYCDNKGACLATLDSTFAQSLPSVICR